MAIGINLQLDPAVAENPFCDHRHHIHAFDLGRNDEWRRFVVRIRGARANGGNERVRAANQIAVPVATTLKKRNYGVAA